MERKSQNSQPTVSIVTVSQYTRTPFLKILAKCIKKQDYQNIIEWVIVDSSHVSYHKTDLDLSDIVEEFKKDTLPNIIYYKSSKPNIGGWRNDTSKLASSDIIVCMDDDDYYPPQRVTEVVEKLSPFPSTTPMIAGCDKLYIYDIYLRKCYQYQGLDKYIGPNHATNNTFGYNRSYLLDHAYDETVHNLEEVSFTKKFTEKMVQLSPERTIVNISHDQNTYNKRTMIFDNEALPADKRYVKEVNTNLEEWITDKEIYQDYLALFQILTQPKKSPYDIVYFLGKYVAWEPTQTNLFGSEQAVKQLAKQWATTGKKVGVYGNLSLTGTIDGVDYMLHSDFRFWDEFQTLILWRIYGFFPYVSLGLKAQKLILDLHDNNIDVHHYISANMGKINQIMVKSKFHQDLLQDLSNNQISKMRIVPNGINEIFLKVQPEVRHKERNPHRLCYCSSYTRGLFRILQHIWPIVYSLEPRAELHVYYGMDYVSDKNFVAEMKKMLSQHGVMDHGRVPIDLVCREKCLSTFNFYYTDTLEETDCISIKESLVVGCIPITSNVNVFRERDGIHLPWLPNTPDFNYQIACKLVELMNNVALQLELREKLYKSPSIISWEAVGRMWDV